MLQRAVDVLLRNLFGFERPERRGEALRFRVLEVAFAFAAIRYAWAWASYMQRLEVVARPLGLANHLDITFLFGPLAFVNAGLITAFIVLGFLRAGRFGYLVAFFALLFQFAGRYSAGEIPHSSNLTGIAIMAFGLGFASFAEPRFQRRFSLGIVYFMIGVTYLSAGISKLIATGPTWVDGHHLWTWIYSRHFHDMLGVGVDRFTAIEAFLLDHLWAATLALSIGLVTELFAWLVWFRKTRAPTLLAILGMHIGIYFTMGIFFVETTILLVLLLLPIEAIVEWWMTRSAK